MVGIKTEIMVMMMMGIVIIMLKTIIHLIPKWWPINYILLFAC